MLVGQRPDYGGSNGLQEGEERSEGPAEQHDVVAVVDGLGERVLVRIQTGEDPRQDGVGVGGSGGLVVAVELEELGVQREDEGEGYLVVAM